MKVYMIEDTKLIFKSKKKAIKYCTDRINLEIANSRSKKRRYYVEKYENRVGKIFSFWSLYLCLMYEYVNKAGKKIQVPSGTHFNIIEVDLID